MVKKGYIKTLEAVIAIVVILLFIFSFGVSNIGVGDVTPKIVKNSQEFIFKTILNDDTLRQAVLDGIGEKGGLLDVVVERNLPKGYKYEIQFCESAVCQVPELPEKTVYIDALYVGEEDNFRIMKLFVWEE